MAVNKKNIMTRYFFVILLMALIGVAIVVKAGITMFAERQYWKHYFFRRKTYGKFSSRIQNIHGLYVR